MYVINCGPYIKLTCSEFFVISDNAGGSTFAINDAKFYVSVKTSKIENNAKLLS